MTVTPHVEAVRDRFDHYEGSTQQLHDDIGTLLDVVDGCVRVRRSLTRAMSVARDENMRDTLRHFQSMLDEALTMEAP